jgi:UDP-N-acetylglucosamine--dolichyl-phosphate N-acetylglucosaminephosphotransferase
MTTALTRHEQWSLLSIFGAGIAIIANSFNGDGNPIVASLAYSGIAFSSTYCLIRWLGDVFMKAGFRGKDMSKARKVEMYAYSTVML